LTFDFTDTPGQQNPNVKTSLEKEGAGKSTGKVQEKAKLNQR
jgi:hypothetical protein